MKAAATRPVLVVVEGDAACPFWMDHWGEEPEGDWSMVEQEEWETTPTFQRRLEDVLGRLAAFGEQVSVVLVTGRRTDPLGLSARWELASTLAAHLAQHGGHGLVVTRGFGQSDAPIAELDELAGDLDEAFEGAVDVAVRVAPRAESSGVRTWAPPPMPAADLGIAAAE